MARYGQAYKERIVGRLLPPKSAALDVVSREVGVSVATLERWRAQALADGAGSGGGQRWTAAARLEAVIATAAMDEATRSAWCRERGLYAAELEAWKRDAIAGLLRDVHPVSVDPSRVATALGAMGAHGDIGPFLELTFTQVSALPSGALDSLSETQIAALQAAL